MPKRKAEREPEEPVEEKQGAEEEPSSSSTSGSDSGTSDDSEYPDVSDGVGGEGSESDSDDEREVVVDFEFYDPQESDYLGLKALLNAYLDGAQYNVSQLADTIIAQGAPGTVIKTGEDEDPVGLLTVLDAHGKRDLEVVKEIKQFIGSHVADSGSRRQLADALDKPGTGLLVSERLLNSPPVISGQLLRQLLDEMSAKAKKGGPPAFQRYVLLTRVYWEEEDNEAAAAPAGPSGGGKGKAAASSSSGGGGGGSGGRNGNLVYVRPEDQFVKQHASCWATWEVPGKAVGKDQLVPLRAVALLEPGHKLSAVAAQTTKFVEDGFASTMRRPAAADAPRPAKGGASGSRR